MDTSEESVRSAKQSKVSPFLETMIEKMMKVRNEEDLDEETTGMIEKLVVLRVATKHINLWIRQLEMKRREV